MLTTLSAYALESTEAVPMDVLVDRDRARVLDPDAGWCMQSVRRPVPVGGDSGKCPLRNLAPERLTASKVDLLALSYL